MLIIKKNVFFTGSDSTMQAWATVLTVKSSIGEELFQNTYNCDSNEPTPLVDTGWIRDPIKEFEFEIKIFETHCGIVVWM